VADQRISDLSAGSTVGATDLFEAEQGGASVKLTGAQMLAYFGGSGGGAVRQMVVTQDNTALSTSSNIPYDSTIPQNSEGVEYTQIATTFTPTDAASILEIEVFIALYQLNSGGNALGALFQDSTANALAAANKTPATSGYSDDMYIRYRVVAGSTSARTYKFRYGANANSMLINHVSGNTTFLGNVIYSHMKVTEFAP
jgi:hypothetical protein